MPKALPIPIKARWFVCGYVVIELLSAVSNAHGASDGVAHVAHLGGMLFGWLLIKWWRRTSHEFNGWDGYEYHEGFMDKVKGWLKKSGERLSGRGGNPGGGTAGHGGRGTWSSSSTGGGTTGNADWDYNARKKEEEAV